MSTAGRQRVMIVDDHSLVAEGVRRILEQDFELVAIVGNPFEALQAVQAFQPDVLLMDIGMPGRNGIETAREIHQRFPSLKIIFLTMHTEAVYLRQAMLSGAQGYVLKSAVVSELIGAIRTVLSGKVFISTEVEDQPEGRFTTEGIKTTSVLSPKQSEVLQLVAIGRSDKEIASFMNISVKTVEFHKTSLRKRLGLRTTADLVRFAIESGLLSR